MYLENLWKKQRIKKVINIIRLYRNNFVLSDHVPMYFVFSLAWGQGMVKALEIPILSAQKQKNTFYFRISNLLL